MGAFIYQDSVLYCEQVPLSALLSQIATPFYCNSLNYIKQQLHNLYDAFERQSIKVDVRYATKANSSATILKLLAQQGAGADTVSGYEIRKSIEAGIPASRIVFSGVGKSSEELAYAITVGVDQINVESIDELQALNKIALAMGSKVSVALRFNPETAAGTHDKISTAYSHSKFGLSYDAIMEVLRLLPSLKAIKCIGLSVHIGSQISSLAPFAEAFGKLLDLAKSLEQAGHNLEVLDFGGGVGVPHYASSPPDFTIDEYAALIANIMRGRKWRCIIEPGRYLVAGSAALISKILYTKGQFLILDAGMNDLMRPALYDAVHYIEPVERPQTEVIKVYDVVGPVCESSDVFGYNINLPQQKAGDALAILGAGAYGMVLANNYNLRPRPAEVMVQADRYQVVRPTQTYAELSANEIIPEWL